MAALLSPDLKIQPGRLGPTAVHEEREIVTLAYRFYTPTGIAAE